MARKSAENIIAKITEAVEKAVGRNPIISLQAERMETKKDIRIVMSAVVQISKKRTEPSVDND